MRALTQDWRLGAPGTGLAWLGETLVAAAGDGRLHFAEAGAQALNALDLHRGTIFAIAADPARQRVVTGGDDGRVCAATPDGSEEMLTRPGRWIEAVTVSRKGVVAVGIGKEVLVWREGTPSTFEVPTTAAALTFDQKGASLAVAHYGGVSLFDPAHPKRAPQRLVWKGSHIRVTFSPNGKFVVSVMSENALHGWRVKDAANMAMSGYPAKPRSLSWSADGRLLASSGADGAIIWSFAGRDGPMGTSAITLGKRGVQVTALTWHPGAPMLALGYRDGAVRLCRAEDGAMLPLLEPNGEPISHLSFSPAGASLAALSEQGRLARFALSAGGES
ncbi:hypothetical protein VE25_08430 [Devosia geojensis]|uniref:Anaphase-promoting complex subunit 4-like WD40 domain-containing protein n=1 Tax=Devosia geojensis TaxID=443610 RepID=A0A0F5FUP7_9HYPH|nr:hypothetical protein VE25_08430 [Devosia geojensis]